MKRRFALMLVTIMLLTLVLTACGGVQQQEAVYNEDGQIVITVADEIVTPTGTNRWVLLRQREFDKQYPNIKVNHVQSYGGDTAHIVEYLTTAFMGGNAPTCMSIPSLIYINDIYNQGLTKDISSFLSEDSDFYKAYDYVQEGFIRTNGEITGYPTGMEIALLGFYNDSLEEAGYDPETFTCETWDEYYEAAKKMTEGKRLGSSLYLYEYFLWPHNWFLSNGAEPATVNEDGTMTLNFASQNMIETCEFFRKLYNDGLTNTNINSVNLGSAMDLIFQKKVASFTMYPTWLGSLTTYGIKPTEITLMQFPKGPSATTQNSAAQLTGYVFNAQRSDEEIKAAITYVEFMTGIEAQKSMAEFVKENEVVTFSLSVYEEVDFYEGMTALGVPQNWIDVTKQAVSNATACTYPSTAFTSYLTTQLPLMTTDVNKDIKETLEYSQKIAEDEWLIGYNESILYD